jgi:hypothetical protein
VVDLGEVPEQCDINGFEFFEFMMGVCLNQGINLHEIRYIETLSASMIN